MKIFVQATEYDGYMYAKFECMYMHVIFFGDQFLKDLTS
jgi:hypothetical protein